MLAMFMPITATYKAMFINTIQFRLRKQNLRRGPLSIMPGAFASKGAANIPKILGNMQIRGGHFPR
jgi:hypothetical protein